MFCFVFSPLCYQVFSVKITPILCSSGEVRWDGRINKIGWKYCVFLAISQKRCQRLNLRLLLLFCVYVPQQAPQHLLFSRWPTTIDKVDTDGSARQGRNRIRHQRQRTRQRKKQNETVCDEYGRERERKREINKTRRQIMEWGRSEHELPPPLAQSACRYA